MIQTRICYRFGTKLSKNIVIFTADGKKRQYPPWEVYLQQATHKRVDVFISLIEQLLPKSIHAVLAPGFELKAYLGAVKSGCSVSQNMVYSPYKEGQKNEH